MTGAIKMVLLEVDPGVVRMWVESVSWGPQAF